jgi:hypothetical protein
MIVYPLKVYFEQVFGDLVYVLLIECYSNASAIFEKLVEECWLLCCRSMAVVRSQTLPEVPPLNTFKFFLSFSPLVAV